MPSNPQDEIKTIHSETELPRFSNLMSPDGLPIPMGENPSYYKGLAILQTSANTAILVATEEAFGKMYYFAYQRSLEKAKIRVVSELKVSGVIMDTLLQDGRVTPKENEKSKVVELDSAAINKFEDFVRAAHAKKASDMHFVIGDANNKDGTVRFRVNGRLVDHASRQDNAALLSMCSAVYNTMSDVSTREETFDVTKIQACAIPFTSIGDNIRLKLRYQHTMRFPMGLLVVLRLLDMQKDVIIRLDSLGYSKWHIDTIRRMLNKPQGLSLMVGTTGSGKSTTLKCLLEWLLELHEGSTNIMTVEDPPEYIIKGVIQIPVVAKDKESAKAAFTDAIRAAMRCDPDALMVGEIRDTESATLIQHATQSGHQAFSTLHAASAIEAIPRLYSIGVEANVMASPDFFSGIIYQKLVRRLCDHCKEPLTYDQVNNDPSFLEKHPIVYKTLQRVMDWSVDKLYVEGHKDCKECQNKRVAGRTVCAEIMIPDAALLDDISRMDMLKAKQHWRSKRKVNDPTNFEGKTAFEHALYKMKLGEVDPFEVDHVFGMGSDDLIDLAGDILETPREKLEVSRVDKVSSPSSSKLFSDD